MKPKAGAIVIADAAPSLVAALAQHAHQARGAFSANTERALRADTAIFTGWCSDQGRASLPALPETVAAFVDAHAATKSPATVRRYVASVAAFHRAAGVDDPTKANAVRFALKRLHRTKGRRQAQAHALTVDLRNRMIDAAGDRPIDLRNKALLAVAYDTGCRRSELVALEVADVRAAADGSGSVLIRRSKTDQEGAGMIRYLAPDTMQHVRAWREAAGVDKGSLFVALSKGGAILGPLAATGADTGAEVSRIFKRMAKAARLKPHVVKAMSGHSARVGLAQDLASAGEDLPAIMQAGGWKSPTMVARYTERMAARRGAVARLAEKQGRADD